MSFKGIEKTLFRVLTLNTSLYYLPTDYYIVINANEIAELEVPPFCGKYSSEDEYREYLEKVQPLFSEYQNDGRIHTINFETLDDIEHNYNELLFLNNFNSSFLSWSNHINVRKDINGLYHVTTNGRHRMYVARKYGLYLLVHVSEEERMEM